MTIIVSVKINDGIVMASDSASTFSTGQVYSHADKIVNLVKGMPIGAMITGNGGIGNESITTLFKDLRSRLSGEADVDWTLNPKSYSIKDVADYVRTFLFAEKTLGQGFETFMQVRICGYSSGKSLSEVWEVNLRGKDCDEPKQVQTESQFGIRWDGSYEALNRLILGSGGLLSKSLVDMGIPENTVGDYTSKIYSNNYRDLCLPAMPIQDAIDLARYLVETTIAFEKFSVLTQPKTVGGAVEIAAITKHEGFKWIQRKHFYQAALNPTVAPYYEAARKIEFSKLKTNNPKEQKIKQAPKKGAGKRKSKSKSTGK